MTLSYTFDIPTPPSVNALFSNVPKVGRIKTSAYKRWMTEAGWRLRSNDQRCITTIKRPVTCLLEVTRTNKRRDIDNCAKPVLDLLVHMAVLKDDSLVDEITVRWRYGDDAKPGATITVTELEVARA